MSAPGDQPPTDVRPIHVINPNSSQIVTEGIAAAARALFPRQIAALRFSTIAQAPAGIVDQRDCDRAAVLVADFVARERDAAAGFVIACFSDPGLFAAAEITGSPVIGIGHASLLAARAAGSRIGVIAVSHRAIPRHMRHYAALGLREAIVGERAIDLAVASSGGELALARAIEVGAALRDLDGADVVILGCAGMTPLRAEVEDALGLPVIDPVAAGLAMALACVEPVAA